eukprot:g2472.t1
MIRKLIFSGLIVFIVPGSPSQLVLALLIALFFSVYAAYTEPFISDTDDVTALLAHVQIFVFIFAALLIRSDVSSAENYDPDVFGAVIVLVILVPIFLCIVIVSVTLLYPPLEAWRHDVERRRRLGLKTVGFFNYVKRVWIKSEKESYAEDEAIKVYSSQKITERFRLCRESIQRFKALSEKECFLLTHILRLSSRIDPILKTIYDDLPKQSYQKVQLKWRKMLDCLCVCFARFEESELKIEDIRKLELSLLDLNDEIFIEDTTEAVIDLEVFDSKSVMRKEKRLEELLGRTNDEENPKRSEKRQKAERSRASEAKVEEEEEKTIMKPQKVEENKDEQGIEEEKKRREEEFEEEPLIIVDLTRLLLMVKKLRRALVDKLQDVKLTKATRRFSLKNVRKSIAKRFRKKKDSDVVPKAVELQAKGGKNARKSWVLSPLLNDDETKNNTKIISPEIESKTEEEIQMKDSHDADEAAKLASQKWKGKAYNFGNADGKNEDESNWDYIRRFFFNKEIDAPNTTIGNNDSIL